MLLFAHTGITLGTVLGLSAVARKTLPKTDMPEHGRFVRVNHVAAPALRFGSDFFAKVDYRLVILGALLPDIIDKPLGQILLADSLDNGRIFAHTLLFFLILLAAGIYRYWRFAKTGIVLLALASGGHLLLDEMWKNPHTLFWPLHGWSFPEGRYENLGNWISHLFSTLENNPHVYIPEAVGLATLILVGVGVIRNRTFIYFIRRGSLR